MLCVLNLYLHVLPYAHTALLRVDKPESVSAVLVLTVCSSLCNLISIVHVCM